MLLSLFLSFTFIGFFSFGGGYGMLPLIQQEVVSNKHWLTVQEFADILAVSQMTPGPIAINTATYVGYKTAGFWGSVFATLGVVVPCLIIIVSMTGIVLKYKNNPRFQGVFQGLRPVVVALVLGAAYLVGKDTLTTPLQFVLAVLALSLTLFTRLHPVLIIFVFGVAGLFIP